MVISRKTILVSLVLGILFSIFYGYFVIPGFKVFEIKLNDIKGKAVLALAARDTYFLKIWGLSKPQKVYFNGRELLPVYQRERKKLKEFHFKLEKSGGEVKNILEIIAPCAYSVKVLNCYGHTEHIAILFKSSGFLKSYPFRLPRFMAAALVSALLIFFIFQLAFLVSRFLFKKLVDEEAVKYGLAFLPCLLVLFIFYLFSEFSGFRILLQPGYFLQICIFLVAIVLLPMFWVVSSDIEQLEGELTLGHKIERWMKARDFSDRCILIYMFLLVLCGGLLFILELKSTIEFIGDIAYFALLAGVIIKFAQFIKQERIKP
jgi:ABC-type Fe3+-siderophore transport system permease subunit